MGYQRLLEYQTYSKSMCRENSKCRHFASVQVKQIVSMARFPLCVSPILMQNEGIWNFHGSLTLNKGKGILYSESLWYPIASSMTNFFHSFRKKENVACFGLSVSPVLTKNEDIWNFYGSLTLTKGKLI